MTNTPSSVYWNKFAKNSAAIQRWDFQSQTVFNRIPKSKQSTSWEGAAQIDDNISFMQVSNKCTKTMQPYTNQNLLFQTIDNIILNTIQAISGLRVSRSEPQVKSLKQHSE